MLSTRKKILGGILMMKKIFKFTSGLVIAMMIASCGSTNQSGTTKASTKQAAKFMKTVNYDSDVGGNLQISNYSGEDLVFFAGNITRKNIIGGVRAAAVNRLFDINSSLQGQVSGNGVFMIRAVRASVYQDLLASKQEVKADDICFTHLVAFDTNDKNRIYTVSVDSISGKGGAKEFIKLENHTPYPIELRLNRPDGEKIATLSPYETGRRFYLAPDADREGYQIWPTYITYNARTGELNALQGSPSDSRTVLPTIDGQTVPPFKMPKDNIFSSSIAYIRISNMYTDGVTLLAGANVKKSQFGNGLINTGRSETYEFAATEEGSFIPGLSLRLGRMGQQLNFGELTLQAGYTYEAVVYDDNGVAKLRLNDKPAKRDPSASGQVQILLES